MHALRPHCDIVVYDGENWGDATPHNLPPFVNFNARNFGPTSWQWMNNTRRIDVLKIDCEGCVRAARHELSSTRVWSDHAIC